MNSTPQSVSKLRHDLRDRLAAIQGYGDLLLECRDLPGWEPFHADLLKLHQTTTHLLQQVNQTLEWARFEAGFSDLPALQSAIRNHCQMLEAMAANLVREAAASQHPMLAMVPRYASAARKLLELSEKSLSAPAMEEVSESLPAENWPAAAGHTEIVRRKELILVADDSEENRHLLEHFLSRKGYNVRMVSDGQAVLDFVKTNRVDLVLLDFMMPPGMNGLEALKRLKADPQTARLPVVMLSSTDDLPTVTRSLQLGADDFLPKPFNPALLSARVESSLAKKRLREQEKKFHERTLSLHLGNARAQEVLENPDLLKPGAIKQEVSFLFSDISNFSLIADRAAPDRLFKLLSKYYQATISCIHEHQGTVMQLVGDSIFAIWNAPKRQENHQALACRGAWALRQCLRQFNEESKDSYDDALETRLGLHAGDASVGNLGSEDRFEFAAIGANTNLASRLEGLNKHLGTEVLISEEMLTAAEASGFVCRPLGRFKFKGLDRVVKVFELAEEKAASDPKPAWVLTFNRGLGLVKEGQFAAAKKVFKEVLQARGGRDGPSNFFLQHIEKLQKDKTDPEWFGVVRMDSK
jgi:adenylate cyclase